MNCENTSALCPSSNDLAQLRQQHVELGRLLLARSCRSAGMAGRLAQRSSASRIWIFDFVEPVAPTRPSSERR